MGGSTLLIVVDREVLKKNHKFVFRCRIRCHSWLVCVVVGLHWLNSGCCWIEIVSIVWLVGRWARLCMAYARVRLLILVSFSLISFILHMDYYNKIPPPKLICASRPRVLCACAGSSEVCSRRSLQIINSPHTLHKFTYRIL